MKLVRCDWVVPIDAPPIANGAVVLDGGTIVDVGPFPQMLARRGDEARSLHGPGAIVDLGRVAVLPALVNAHTVVGVLALVTWVVVLVAPDGNFFDGAGFGIVSLAFWWALVVLGLLILVRWLPSHGKHASEGSSDTWSDGPGLSILGHVGMFVGVCVFTLAYLQAKI